MQTTYEKQNDLLKYFQYDTERDLQLRVFGTADNPLFSANDICNILGCKNPVQAVNLNVDPEDVINVEAGDRCCVLKRTSRPRLILLTKPGLYCLLLKSRNTRARKVKRWITSTVMPAIILASRRCSPVNPLEEVNRFSSMMRDVVETMDILEKSSMDYDDIALFKGILREKLLSYDGECITDGDDTCSIMTDMSLN